MRPNNQKKDRNPSYIILALSLLICVYGIVVYMMGHFLLDHHPSGPHMKYHIDKVIGIDLAVIPLALNLLLIPLLLVILLRIIELFPPPPEVPPQQPNIRAPPEFLDHVMPDQLVRTHPPLRNYPTLELNSNGEPMQDIREDWRVYADETIGEGHSSPVVNNTSGSQETGQVAVDQPQPRRVHQWVGNLATTDSTFARDIRAGDARRVDNGASILGPPGSMGIGSSRDIHSDTESMPAGSINGGLDEEEEGSDDEFMGPTPYRRMRSINDIYAATEPTMMGRNNAGLGEEEEEEEEEEEGSNLIS